MAQLTWADWGWPEWVPIKVREQIEDFWRDSLGRGPEAWLRNSREQGAPVHGETVTLPDGFRSDAPMTTGRYVHAWNNVGRLVRDDGTFAYTHFSPSLLRREV
jgi:hypothetical protein